jgi:hypothetical protein
VADLLDVDGAVEGDCLPCVSLRLERRADQYFERSWARARQ